MPATKNCQRLEMAIPDDTTPHMNAQIGGNQVIGFSNSRMSRGAGIDVTNPGVFAVSIAKMLTLTANGVKSN
jgi:hypothetical protein